METTIHVHIMVELYTSHASTQAGMQLVYAFLQLKKHFKDPLIIVKFFIILKLTDMERLEVKLQFPRLKAMTILLSL